jgi:hypothetical protein
VTPERGNQRTNLRRTSGAISFVLPANARSPFWQLPVPDCVGLAMFPPAIFDSSADFLSVAVATFQRATFDSSGNFSCGGTVSSGPASGMTDASKARYGVAVAGAKPSDNSRTNFVQTSNEFRIILERKIL